MLIDVSDADLDTIYKALAEIPAKFSHPVMSRIEAEVKRINDEAAASQKKSETDKIQAAIAKALAESKEGSNQEHPNGIDPTSR